MELHQKRSAQIAITLNICLKSGRTLLERFKMKGWAFKTQFTYFYTYFLVLSPKQEGQI